MTFRAQTLRGRMSVPVIILVTSFSIALAQVDDKVHSEALESIENEGQALASVGLKAPWRPEGPLSEEMGRVQRKAIAAAQNYLLAELGTTEHRVTRRYRKIPGIALEVRMDTLKVLARSAAVTNVLEDRLARSTK